MEAVVLAFSIPRLDGWSVSRFVHLSLVASTSYTHSTAGLLIPAAGLDAEMYRKIRESNYDLTVVELVA
jgi:hypothetical protein